MQTLECRHSLQAACSWAGYQLSHWQMATTVAISACFNSLSSVHPWAQAFLPQRAGSPCRHQLQRIVPFPGESKHFHQMAEASTKQFLCVRERSRKHKVAHSKETDDLCMPNGAKPYVKGLHIHQHKWL